MAYISGTATDYKDLLAIAAAFWAANGATVLYQSDTKVYFRGTGLSGLDEIYCGIETYEDPANGRFNWELFGSIGWRTNAEFYLQPMSSGDDAVFSYFWNAPIPYWLVAHGRRIMGFAKVSTVYIPIHLGLLTPPATDAQYPYPLFIGGCCNAKLQNYSYAALSGFWAAQSTINGKLWLPGGGWGIMSQATQNSFEVHCKAVTEKHSQRANILTAPGGGYDPEQIFIVDVATRRIFGAIDGLFRVSGYNNSAENIITIGGENHMVFPDIYRSTYGDYCVMRLA